MTPSADALHACFAVARGPAFQLVVDVIIPPGVTLLLGPSGAGKSSALDVIAGFLLPTHGSVRLGTQSLTHIQPGAPVHCQPPPDRRIGYVMQQPSLFPHLTVYKNLAYSLSGQPRAVQQAQITAMAQLLGLIPFLPRLPHSLSGGERQRVTLGRALLQAPRVLLLDEPLSAVDLGHRQELLVRLQAVLRPLQIPVLYVTHSPEEQALLAPVAIQTLRAQVQVDESGHTQVTLANPSPPPSGGSSDF